MKRWLSMLLVFTLLFTVVDQTVNMRMASAIPPGGEDVGICYDADILDFDEIELNPTKGTEYYVFGHNVWTDFKHWAAGVEGKFTSEHEEKFARRFLDFGKVVEQKEVTNPKTGKSVKVNDLEDAPFEFSVKDLMAGLSMGISMFNTFMATFNNVNSLLHMLGILQTGPTAEEVHILNAIANLEENVRRIDDHINDLATDIDKQFNKMNLNFDKATFEHYRDVVWTAGFLPKVNKLRALQDKFSFTLGDHMVAYAKSWQGADGLYNNNVRLLFADDEDGQPRLLFASNNLTGPGNALNATPAKAGTDTVEYSLTIPGSLIHKHMDQSLRINQNNCEEAMRAAFKAAVEEAVETQHLEAYEGFYLDWAELSSAQREMYYDKLADDMLNTVSFAASIEVMNDVSNGLRNDIYSSYKEYTSAILGKDSQMTPMAAQYQMIALTHAFEGEAAWDIIGINSYLSTLNTHFGTFVCTAMTLVDGFDKQALECKDLWVKTTNAVQDAFTDFYHFNDNYCYQVGAPLQYKELELTSHAGAKAGSVWDDDDEIEVWSQRVQQITKSDWYLIDPDIDYPENTERALAMIDLGDFKSDSAYEQAVKQNDAKLRPNIISADTLLKIYSLYMANYGSKMTFAKYLRMNNVVLPDEADINDSLCGMENVLLTSDFKTESIDLNVGTPMRAITYPFQRKYGSGKGDYDDGYNTIGKPGTYVDFKSGANHNRAYYDLKVYNVNREWDTTRGQADPSNGSFKFAERVYGKTLNVVTGEYSTGDTYATRAMNHYSSALAYFADPDATWDRLVYISNENVREEDRGDFGGKYVYFGFSSSTKFPTLVAQEMDTMTIPASTKVIPNGQMGKYTLTILDKLTIAGNPTIREEAFNFVGSPEKRVYLDYPEGNVKSEDLLYGWHGGFFGDAKVHYVGTFRDYKNENDVVYVTGENAAEYKLSIPDDMWPEHRTFVGWSTQKGATKPMANIEAKDGLTLYAVWVPDHEHKAVDDPNAKTTCTANGYDGRMICSICSDVVVEGTAVEAFGHDYGLTGASMSGEKTCARCGRKANFETVNMGDFEVAYDSTMGTMLNILQYSNGVLTIRGKGTVAVKNKNPGVKTSNRITYGATASAELVLCGVNIGGEGDNNRSITIPSDMANDLQIILASGSNNILTNSLYKSNQNGKRLRISSPDGTGKLNSSGESCGIGGGDCQITIESGDIRATSTYGPGIGQGWACTGLIINGGTIYAQGGNNNPGIGGRGINGVVINGGNITAIGGKNGAGIGTGAIQGTSSVVVKDLIINGGTIYAESKGSNTPIGGPCTSSGYYRAATCENLRINGGVITTKSSDWIAIGARDSHPIVAPTATIKVDKEMNYAVNPQGEKVQLVKIENPNGAVVTVDGEAVPVKQHSATDQNLYLYLTGHENVHMSDNSYMSVLDQHFHHVIFVTGGYCEPLPVLLLHDGELVPRPEDPVFDLDYLMYLSPDISKGVADNGKTVTFMGWYADINRTIPFNFNKPVEDDIEIYAKWSNTDLYVVTFNMNGIGLQVSPQYVLKGAKAVKPEDPTAYDYVFDGWYTNQTCTVAYNFDKPVTANTELFAKWIKASDVPQTGDTAMPGVWLSVIMLSGLWMIFSTIRKRRHV